METVVRALIYLSNQTEGDSGNYYRSKDRKAVY